MTDRDRRILDFETSWWTRPGPKATAIRAQLGVAPAAYYRRLSSLIDIEEARAYAPLVVLRLRRRRRERRRERIVGVAQPHRHR